MSLKGVRKDPAAKTMTVTAEFDAPVHRVWQLWADPRQLERWWGPPSWPATVVDHDFVPGGRVSYYMTGPEGERSNGWWRITAVDAPERLEFEDGSADDEGRPNKEMPTMKITVTIAESSPGTTRMVIETTFPSTEAMERFLEMGMEEGMASALGQIDHLLEEGART